MKRRGRRFPIVVASSIVVLGAAVSWFFLSERGNQTTKEQTNPSRRIKETKPAKPARKAETEKPVAKAAEPRPAAPVPVAQLQKPALPRKNTVRTNMNALAASTNAIFRNGIEQLLLRIFSCPLGMPPQPLPYMIPEREMKRLTEILIDKHEITDKDSEITMVSKDLLNQAKDLMIKHIKNGGEPEDFISGYHEELVRAFERRKDAEMHIAKMERDGEDPEVISKFVDKINEGFTKDGIMEVDKPQSVEDYENAKEQQ